MTWICYIGIELSARTQYFLLGIEIFTLALFAVVALWKVYVTGTPALRPHRPQLVHPFGIPGGTTALVDGVLLGVFIYWGWDSGVCVNEESEDSANGPGQSGGDEHDPARPDLCHRRRAGPGLSPDRSSSPTTPKTCSAPSAASVLGSPLDKLLIITVLTSASASTQTTILPTARTTLSMARFGSIPEAFGRIHPRYLTPASRPSRWARSRWSGRSSSSTSAPASSATRSSASASRSPSTTG